MTRLLLQGASTLDSTLAGANVFDTVTGIKQSLVHVHFPMQNNTLIPLPIALIQQLWARNQLTMVSWGTFDLATGLGWAPTNILNGMYDEHIRTQAIAAALMQIPFFLRLDCEMNGPWEPWYTADQELFADMWRHIVSIFREENATNVTWVWCPSQVGMPNTGALGSDRLAGYYPGDDYVNWVGFDAYNWSVIKGMPWLSFAQTLRGGIAGIGDTWGTIKDIAPLKPMMLCEFATHNAPSDKLTWLTYALAQAPNYFDAISYFNSTDIPAGNPSWPITSFSGPTYAAGLNAGPYAQVGTYDMPPLGQPILPLYRITSWGDPSSILANFDDTLNELETLLG